jgi:drug/metabolite transporter (DMT)-like permease
LSVSEQINARWQRIWKEENRPAGSWERQNVTVMANSGSTTPQSGRAALLMLAAMLIIGLIDNYIVVIAESVSLWQFHATRSAINMSLLAVIAAFGGAAIWPRRWGAVLVRSWLFTGSMLIYFGCLAFLPISQVVAGLFTSPIIVMVLSATVFGERVGPVRWLAAMVGFAGILLVIGIGQEAVSMVSVLPLVAAVLYALSAISTRRYCAGETVASLMFWFFAAIGLSSLVMLAGLTIWPQAVPEGQAGFLVRGLAMPSAAAWVWILAQAVGSIIAVGAITRAYQIGEASYVAVFEYSLMVFAPLWAWVLWREDVPLSTMLGVALIMLAGLVIASRSKH